MLYKSVAAVFFVLVLGFTAFPGTAAAQDYTFNAIRVEGKMAELLHLDQARRLVAVAETIAAG